MMMITLADWPRSPWPPCRHLIVMLMVVGAMVLLLGWSAFIIVGIVRWDRDPFPPDRASHDPGPQAGREVRRRLRFHIRPPPLPSPSLVWP